MPSVVRTLVNQDKINVPFWLLNSLQYETEMGSHAYGLASKKSDIDIYGFCIPPKEHVFPYSSGHIFNFSHIPQVFTSFSKHHIFDNKKQEYDVTIYSIVKFFNLCMQNNPNMVDSLFTSNRAMRFETEIGTYVKANRHIFLHKGAYYKFMGYAAAQYHKMFSQKRVGKRAKSFELYGYDPKFAYHLVRLCLECEQILIHQDLDLECNNRLLRSIKDGELKKEQFEKFFSQKKIYLEDAYQKSTLPEKPRVDDIKRILLNCLEMTYGTLECLENRDKRDSRLLDQIENIISQRYQIKSKQ